MIYSGFASIYDRLMQDIPYQGWVDYLGRLFERHEIRPGDILDIGCGTGNVTIPLAEMGYNLTGIDISPEMLAVAEEKARSKGLKIKWIQQDMKEMDLGSLQFDLVVSMTDSLNYLQGEQELRQVFTGVKALLRSGGWFVFDLNSYYKIQEVFGNHVFTLLEDDIAYIWENTFDHDTNACLINLTFFVRERDGKYRRFSEQHREMGYETDKVCDLLAESGFRVEAVYAEGTFKGPGGKTERIYFVARRSV